jgi:hypothetical protein
MPRFELEIDGEDLGRAQAALNAADIPTISSGGGQQPQLRPWPGVGQQPQQRPWPGRAGRGFRRSAAFPILIVIVLAFFAQRLFGSSDDNGGGGLAVITYVLPFLLFLAFWLYLMSRMRSEGPSMVGGARESEPATLKAVLDAASGEEAEERVRTNLPVDADYQVTAARRW